MDVIFDVLIHGLISVDYSLHLDGAPSVEQERVIERETRNAGGTAFNCAKTLADWGARVCLCGNPLAQDSNGRLVLRELNAIQNLSYFSSAAPLEAEYETPYHVRCLARDGSCAVLTRHQSALQHDALYAAYAATSTPDALSSHMSTHAWPQVRLAANCDDYLPCAARHLERAMKECGTPFFTFDALHSDALRSEVQSVVFAAALWARLNGWETERGVRFASIAQQLALEFPNETPSLGQIEAVSEATRR